MIENKIKIIPEINEEIKLVVRLLPVVMGDFDQAMGHEGGLYLRLFCRLIDKAVYEYGIARKLILEEIKSSNRLKNRWLIINHLENCLSAISRVVKTFDLLIDGIYDKKKNKKEKREQKILEFISKETVAAIGINKISVIRNRIEHIDEDIYLNNFKSNLFLDIDKEYKEICIGGKCICLVDLVTIIQDYRKLVMEIFDNLPNRAKGNEFYYDKLVL